MAYRVSLRAAATAALLFSGCASQEEAGGIPSLKSRQSAAWKQYAGVLRAGRFTVWYHGGAVDGATARPGHWNGTVTGDIFAQSPRGYLVIPNGSLVIDAQNQIQIVGPHRTVVF